eukprot:RCo028355
MSKLPGDVAIELSASNRCCVAGGLVRDGKTVRATHAGFLKTAEGTKGSRSWIDGSIKRYVPKHEDPVIGVVVRKTVDNYTVDIGAAHLAVLDALAFDGASRRNRPALQVGSVVYARVQGASRDMDPELTCCSVTAEFRKDWVTGLGLFGELQGGYCFSSTSSLTRTLMAEHSPVTEALGEFIPFEIAVGANSVVWVKSSKLATTIFLVNILQRAEGLTATQLRQLVQQAVPRLDV